MNTLWGKLASDILMQDWENAIDDVTKLKDTLDNFVSGYRMFCWPKYRKEPLHWDEPGSGDATSNVVVDASWFLERI